MLLWYYSDIMKTISITIDEALLRAVDRAARMAKRTRSDVFRLAIRAWLASARHHELVREEREAYLRQPVGPDEFGGLIAAQDLWSEDSEGER